MSPDEKRLHEQFLRHAIKLGVEKMREGHGGPFGAVVVRDGKIVAEGFNSVLRLNDPTAHAEVQAIRNACKTLANFQLTDCDVYSSCEPCPMCLGALYWARPRRIFFAGSRKDAAEAGFDDHFIYEELARAPEDRELEIVQMIPSEGRAAFDEWKAKTDKVEY